jgi:coenzyme F420-reducing hydrogenase beta subunit
VFGAAFDAQFELRHIAVESEDELHKLRGSKYTQSAAGAGVFSQVRDFLRGGRKVLFSGTPCQVAQLKNFLKRQNENCENLLCIDLLCHGTPVTEFWRAYRDYLEEKHRAKLRSFSFRDKTYGWKDYWIKATFSNDAGAAGSTDTAKEQTYHCSLRRDPFMRGFLDNYTLHKNCFFCPFTKLQREGDITLGDFWGYREKKNREFRNTDEGVSAVLVNTPNGAKHFAAIRDTLLVRPTLPAEIAARQKVLREPPRPAKNRDAFWSDFRAHGFDFVRKKYLYPKPLKLRQIFQILRNTFSRGHS